jgi:protease I
MSLQGTRVALLIEDDYQELEAWYPRLRLEEAGADVTVIGSGTKTTYKSKLGYEIDADASPADVSADDFDAVIVPGGFAPDHMRLHRPMIDLVREIYEAGKLTASICHGGWILVSAGALKGRRATGYEPIRDDVENAGGTWVDESVVVDGNVITSRTPPDLPDFLREIVAYLESGGTATATAATGARTGLTPDDEYR